MIKLTLNLVAKTATGIALGALLAGQWALISGPMDALAEQGRVAAENSNIAGFAAYGGLHTILLICSPLIFGAIGICVLAAYLAFTRMQGRQLVGREYD